MQFTFAEQLKVLLDRKGLSISQLAELTDTTRQNLSQKIKENSFDIKWMQKIADALDTKVFIGFADFMDNETTRPPSRKKGSE